MSLELLAVYDTDGDSSGVLVKSKAPCVDDIDKEFYHLYEKNGKNKSLQTKQVV